MTSMPCENMLSADIPVINESLRLMAAYLRPWSDHMFRAGSAIRYDPHACGPGALACTGGPHGRVLVLARRPSVVGATETLISLRHEADHIRIRAGGTWWIEHHNCGPCNTAESQAMDPIYQRDAFARQAIRDGLQAEAQARAQEAAEAARMADLFGSIFTRDKRY